MTVPCHAVPCRAALVPCCAALRFCPCCALPCLAALVPVLLQLDKTAAALEQLQSEHADLTHVLIEAKVELAEKKGE